MCVSGKTHTITLGKLKLNSRVFLAPMSGITDYPFRDIVDSFGGAACLTSEMVASESALRDTFQSKKKMTLLTSGKVPACVQLVGVRPEAMAEAARIAEQEGADIIDINMGCPAKKIVNTFSGSALMRDLDLAKSIISAVVSAVSVPVTLKMRKGWDHDTQNAPELARMAEQEGIKMIAVHGRTRAQFYSGRSDWHFFKEVKKHVKIPVIGNGDIQNKEDAAFVMQETGVDGVMLGRACYGRPWLLSGVRDFLDNAFVQKSMSVDKIREVVQRHLEKILEFYGLEKGLRIARKHLGWYSRSLADSTKFRAEINRTECLNTVRRSIQNFFT